MAKPKLEAVLAAVPLFEGLSKQAAEADRRPGRDRRTTWRAHSIVREGDPGDAFFVVLTGQAKVTVKAGPCTGSCRATTSARSSLLDGGERTATVATRDADDAAR